MNPAQMQNNLFDSVLSSFTLGLIPDVQTAIMACLVCFVGYIVVDLIWGQAFGDWWEKTGQEQEYKQYKKNRDKQKHFKDRYNLESTDHPVKIREHGSSDANQIRFNRGNF